MSTSEYTKVYNGNFILVTRIKSELENIGIIPIIKDEGESQRLFLTTLLNTTKPKSRTQPLWRVQMLQSHQ